MATLKDKTANGLLWGGVSNGLQQLLNLFFGIFLARLLDSSEYGLVGMLAIFSGIAGTVQDCGFPAALINKINLKHEDCNAVFWFNTFISIVFYSLFFFFAPLIADFFGHEELTILARVVFLGFVISGTSIVHNALLYKEMRMKQMAKINITSLACSGIVGVTLAFIGVSYWSLVGQTLAYITCISTLRWHYCRWRPTLNINMRPLRPLFSFSVKLLLTNIVNQVNNNIFSAILGRHYTPADVGYYTQGNKWDDMGAQTINGMSGSIAQPAFAEVGRNDHERLRRVLRSLLRFTAFISFPALFGLALIANELIVITIGTKWLPAVALLVVLCLKGAVLPINNVYNQLAVSLGRSDVVFWCNIIFGAAQIGMAFLMFRFGILWMVRSYSAGFVVMMIVWQVIAKRLIGFSHCDAIRCIAPYTAVALAVMVATYYITLPISNVVLLLLLKIIVAAALYATAMKVCHAKVMDESISFLKQKITHKKG